MSTRAPQRTALSLSFLALLMLVLPLAPRPAAAQSINMNANLMSRYVWRGYDFGQSFSIQPTLAYSNSGFTIGTWASYSISADGAGANEHDIYASYSFGNFSVGITDYYFPSGSPGFLGGFNNAFPDNNIAGSEAPDFFSEDAHVLEPNASVTLPGSFPLSLYGAVNVTNDDDNSVYLQASYPFMVMDVSMNLSAGVIPMESSYYGTNQAAWSKAALSASKSIQITDTFDLPISASYILNPYEEESFLVFGITIAP